MKKTLLSAVMALVLALSLLPVSARAATYDYPVDGGNLKFDPTTGTITNCDNRVYNVDIPSEIYGAPVRVIGKNAFDYCSELVSVTIPSSVTRIEKGAFDSCKKLYSISIPSSVTEIGESNNGNSVGVFSYCSALETITIPGSVEMLNEKLFLGCSNLRSVTLEEGVKKIGSNVFGWCGKLKELTLPDSLTTIGKEAFEGCHILETVTIGRNVNYIDENAFDYCSELTALYFRGDAPKIGGDIINKFAPGFTIYYPEGASGWTTPTWNGYITKPYNLPGVTPETTSEPTPTPTPTPAPTANTNTAYARTQTIDLDGKMLVLPTYALKDSNGNETNFVKLRDIAYVMNGTAAKFNVGWDGAVNITPRNDYAPDGTELKTPFSGDRAYKDNTAATKIDGVTVSLRAIVLTDDNGGGYTYFKLRDLGEALGFNVGYSNTRGIYIESSKPYTADN